MNDISMNFKMKKNALNQRCILIDMWENQKYSNNTARRNFPPLVLYKKKSKSLLTSWLTFLLLYNCSVNIPWKQPKKFFLALFSNFNQQQQQLLVKKIILYSSCQQAVFLFVKYYMNFLWVFLKRRMNIQWRWFHQCFIDILQT